jgi:hypothetical protein
MAIPNDEQLESQQVLATKMSVCQLLLPLGNATVRRWLGQSSVRALSPLWQAVDGNRTPRIHPRKVSSTTLVRTEAQESGTETLALPSLGEPLLGSSTARATATTTRTRTEGRNATICFAVRVCRDLRASSFVGQGEDGLQWQT